MKYRNLLGVAALLIGMTQSAAATDFSYTGNFFQDDNVQFFSFNIGASSNVTIETLSYAGGTNAANQVIAGGGFIPSLQLFLGTGMQLNSSQPSNSDAAFSEVLAAGTYILALTELGNIALGDLPGGVLDPNLFSQYGTGNYTSVNNNIPGAGGSFLTPDGSQRDNHWALDILNVNSGQNLAVVPEPELLPLMSVGLLIMVSLIHRRRTV